MYACRVTIRGINRIWYLPPLILFCIFGAFALGCGQKKEMIFSTAPFPSAHASTLVELKSGGFLAAWFGGTREGANDVAIWSSFRDARGWSKPRELVREPNVPCWNPVLFHAANGRLWLYYKFGPKFTWWTGGRRYSDDEGKTWSAIEHLPAGLIGPVRAKPLLLPDGTLVAGSSVESYGSWAAWIEISHDDGSTWRSVGPVTLASLQHAGPLTPTTADAMQPTGIIQPVVVPMGGDKLRLFARSSLDIGRIVVADSHDGGLSWTVALPLDLPNPNAGIDVVRLHDGRIVLIYNDTTHGRSPLNLAVSDDGEHFQNFAVLEDQPGEFSYPALIQGGHGDLHITYTYNRQHIAYVQYPLAKIPHPSHSERAEAP